ncbi:hypothetical protein RDV89_00835 [Nocardioides zeae]|uniref:DUF732 domain-containing protein n=1 Tax=Nocardioides imazamoxiresistens TaxID=3231893 RepID=A0ABU3PRS8_9ACTN|nr:hypothetical protein [Nocardioides zeae]MDT9591591.1 hypothetical protein [Nocardioides zeae]
MRRATSISLVALALLAGCGGEDSESSATETVTQTVTATEEVTSTVTVTAEPEPSPAASDSLDLTPSDGDIEAAAVYVIQTESQSYAGASDELVRQVLDLTCFSLMSLDGQTVGDDQFELAEVGLDAAGVYESEYPMFIRAAAGGFCPQVLPPVVERYGS